MSLQSLACPLAEPRFRSPWTPSYTIGQIGEHFTFIIMFLDAFDIIRAIICVRCAPLAEQHGVPTLEKDADPDTWVSSSHVQGLSNAPRFKSMDAL